MRAIAHQLPEKVAHAVVAYLDGPLRENPWHVGKPLDHEFEGLYSARTGSYRIIYKIENHKVLVIVVDVRHRATVYAMRLKDLNS